jgi:threonine aldolase
MIDLRSDTVTHPTPAMMTAIAQAQLGDDVWGDDPTVNHLQELAAAKLGMEASLFVPSGTMGNLIASLVHCPRGSELIVGDKAHIFRWEGGNVSMVGGIHPYVLPSQPDGTLALADIETAVRVEDVHLPSTAAIALENTQNSCGGVAIPPAYFVQVRQIADRHGLAIHLDGARLFNAAVALNAPVQAFTSQVDSVMVCLSKGLCAPVGSMLAGSRAFIARANKMRKLLGGGMRQAGILAAAGIVALEEMVERLADDHQNAARLSQGLAAIPGIQPLAAAPGTVTTNMVYIKLDKSLPITAESLVKQLDNQYQIKIDGGSSGEFRLVTHYWVTAEDVAATINAFQEILDKASSTGGQV